ncbi:MAG TPA: shikimate kinase [Actinomycetota bacterium]|nr:shikimate kinase [Actinomycetota bacterium]
MLIALIGFMGAGKSSVGRLLAQRLNVPFLDADEAIEQSTGRTIADFFSTEGEQGFRVVEKEVVADLLDVSDAVVALGGGAVEDAACRERLRGATVVHLDVDTHEALRRIGNGNDRPMLAAHDPAALHARRRPVYESIADISVASNGPVEDIVDELVSLLDRPDPGTVDRLDDPPEQVDRLDDPPEQVDRLDDPPEQL